MQVLASFNLIDFSLTLFVCPTVRRYALMDFLSCGFPGSLWIHRLDCRIPGPYKPVKSKLKHPPPGNPWAFEFLEILVQIHLSWGRKAVQMPHYTVESRFLEPLVWVYLVVRTCELFLCFVAIVRVRAIMLTSLFSLFYVTGEFHRFLHRGRALGFLNLPMSRTKPCFPWICFTQALQFYPRFLEPSISRNSR